MSEVHPCCFQFLSSLSHPVCTFTSDSVCTFISEGALIVSYFSAIVNKTVTLLQGYLCYFPCSWDQTPDTHNTKEEKFIWLTVHWISVLSWLVPRQGSMAEGPGGGECSRHGSREAGHSE